MKKTLLSRIVVSGLAICQLSASVLSVSALETGNTYEKGIVVADDDYELKNQLLGIENPEDYFLGTASQFAMFLSGNLSAYNSDCEGRIAVGGGANIVETGYCYAVDVANRDSSNFNPYISAGILGNGIITNLDLRNSKFVVSADTPDDNILFSKEQAINIYRANLINFDNEFEFLRNLSSDVSTWESNGTVEINSPWQGCTVFRGDSEVNVFNISAEQMEEISQGCQTEYRVPTGSTVIVNVSGDKVTMMGNQGTFFISDGVTKALSNNDELAGSILYNCYDAQEVEYTGSFYGTTLAPNAEFTSSNYGHISGQIIGQSFNGIIEVGLSLFNKNPHKPVETPPPTETTETTLTTPPTDITMTTTSKQIIETTVPTTEPTTTPKQTTVSTTEPTTTPKQTTVTTTEPTTTPKQTTATTTEPTTTPKQTTVTTTEPTTTPKQTTVTTTEPTTTPKQTTVTTTEQTTTPKQTTVSTTEQTTTPKQTTVSTTEQTTTPKQTTVPTTEPTTTPTQTTVTTTEPTTTPKQTTVSTTEQTTTPKQTTVTTTEPTTIPKQTTVTTTEPTTTPKQTTVTTTEQTTTPKQTTVTTTEPTTTPKQTTVSTTEPTTTPKQTTVSTTEPTTTPKQTTVTTTEPTTIPKQTTVTTTEQTTTPKQTTVTTTEQTTTPKQTTVTTTNNKSIITTYYYQNKTSSNNDTITAIKTIASPKTGDKGIIASVITGGIAILAGVISGKKKHK